MVLCPPIGPDGHPIEMVGLDSSIIQNPKAWVASGHAGGFSDPMVDCRESKQRYRADHLSVLGHGSAGVMFAYIQGDDETRSSAEKKLAKAYKIELPNTEAVDLPLNKLPQADYARVVGPHAKERGTLTEPRQFNLMLTTEIGAVDPVKAYLRPETAQGIFLEFKNIVDTTPRQNPLRRGPGRQEVPQRSHAAQFHLPLPRVRADGDGMVLPSG